MKINFPKYRLVQRNAIFSVSKTKNTDLFDQRKNYIFLRFLFLSFSDDIITQYFFSLGLTSIRFTTWINPGLSKSLQIFSQGVVKLKQVFFLFFLRH